MSALDGIISIVKNVSPLVAAALGSPLAGMALSLISNAFGSTSKNPDEILGLIQKDPSYQLKIKQIEFDHEKDLMQIQSDDFKNEVEDRMDARKNETEKEKLGIHEYTPAALAYILTIGVFISLYYLFTHDVPSANKELIVSIISALTTVWVSSMAYYHGSSAGSRNKEKMLMGKK